MRFPSRNRWVSTAIVGWPKALFSTTLAVFRPTPGSASSASRSSGTLPPCLSISCLRQGDHVLCLAAEQSDGLDVVPDRIFTQGNHLFRRVGDGEEGLRRAVHTFVGGLGRKYDCNKEGEVIDEVEFTLGFRICGLKPAEHFLDLLRFETACFGHEFNVPLSLQG